MEFSFLHIADIHLDRPFSGIGEYSFDERLNKVCNKALERTFTNVIDYAITKNVDFILIAGDTFDTSEKDFSSKIILKRGLERLISANIGVYIICGNHDCLETYNRTTFNYQENSKVKIIGLNTINPIELAIENKQGDVIAKLHALSFREEIFNETPVKYFKKVDNTEKSNLFHIGLLHCDLNGASNSAYAPCLSSELQELNYDYYALGHIHKPTDNDSIVQYSGTIQGRNTKETGAHGVRYIKVSNNNIIKNIFVPLDVVRFEDITIDISEADDAVMALEIIEDKIQEIISFNNESVEIYLIRPYIIGCCACYNEIDDKFFNILSEKIKSDFAKKIYISKAQCSITPKVDEAVLKDDTGISGEIYKVSQDENVLVEGYTQVENSLKNLISECNFTIEEYNRFREDIIKSAKSECENISSIIYNSNGVNS